MGMVSAAEAPRVGGGDRGEEASRARGRLHAALRDLVHGGPSTSSKTVLGHKERIFCCRGKVVQSDEASEASEASEEGARAKEKRRCLFATGSEDKTVGIWIYGGVGGRGSGFRLLHTLQGHDEEVLSVEWSPTGRLLASASADNTVMIWELPDRLDRIEAEAPALVGRVRHGDHVYRSLFTTGALLGMPGGGGGDGGDGDGDGDGPMGKEEPMQLLVTCSSNQVLCWSLSSGREGLLLSKTLDSRGNYVYGGQRNPSKMVHIFDVAVLRGNRLAAACSDGTVRLLTLRRSGDSERVLGPFDSPAGCLARIKAQGPEEEADRLCLCCTDGTVYVYRDSPEISKSEGDSERRLFSWRAHQANIFDCQAVGTDRLLTCSSDGTVKLWDLRDAEARHVATFEKKNYPFHSMHLVFRDDTGSGCGGGAPGAGVDDGVGNADADADAEGEEEGFVSGLRGAGEGILVAAGGTTGMFGTPWFAQVVDFSVL